MSRQISFRVNQIQSWVSLCSQLGGQTGDLRLVYEIEL